MGLPVAHFLAAAGCGFELHLFEPKSPLPGNGISWAETKAPKRARRFKDAIAETEPARTIPPIRGYSPRTRKSPLVEKCVVGAQEVQQMRRINALGQGAGVWVRLKDLYYFRQHPNLRTTPSRRLVAESVLGQYARAPAPIHPTP
jgi:hypothetical protein